MYHLRINKYNGNVNVERRYSWHGVSLNDVCRTNKHSICCLDFMGKVVLHLDVDSFGPHTFLFPCLSLSYTVYHSLSLSDTTLSLRTSSFSLSHSRNVYYSLFLTLAFPSFSFSFSLSCAFSLTSHDQNINLSYVWLFPLSTFSISLSPFLYLVMFITICLFLTFPFAHVLFLTYVMLKLSLSRTLSFIHIPFLHCSDVMFTILSLSDSCFSFVHALCLPLYLFLSPSVSRNFCHFPSLSFSLLSFLRPLSLSIFSSLSLSNDLYHF